MKLIKGILFTLSLLGFSSASSARQALTYDIYHLAVQSQSRLERDIKRDATRHPKEVLAFFEIEQGQTILDLFSGGGYYSELISYVVGPKGKVIAHNNQAYLPFAKEDLDERRYATRLPNVTTLLSEANDLDLAAGYFDRVFYILGFHDIYYRDETWPEIDDEKLIAKLFHSLKPGGIVAIIDHDAMPGTGLETAQAFHRLSSEHVIKKMTQAGFILTDSAEILKNEADPLTISVFDKAIRGKTSRYMLKFTKPQLH
ncbi:class I SAM-dependent methyltransferase [uncultured Shewanella sp.]|uniref:class I SAM-dependent methyltransferase n=1 Tax=Shewanella atlantica TaxID=271099 RepID=UPI00262895B7|nr:methyltransferase domain-containing protein [uncultured Shewanella sp.]